MPFDYILSPRAGEAQAGQVGCYPFLTSQDLVQMQGLCVMPKIDVGHAMRLSQSIIVVSLMLCNDSRVRPNSDILFMVDHVQSLVTLALINRSYNIAARRMLMIALRALIMILKTMADLNVVEMIFLR